MKIVKPQRSNVSVKFFARTAIAVIVAASTHVVNAQTQENISSTIKISGDESRSAIRNPDEKNTTARLNTVVVTATRTPTTVEDAPVAVEVVGGETLRKISKTTLARTLDFLPGVVVKRSTKDGYNVYMQGFDGDRVLILVDGRRLIAPTGAAVDLDQISVANVDHIEIVRGASSVLYGSSAMGGVINIIIKKDTGNHLSVTSEISSYVGNEIKDDKLGYQQRLESSGTWRQWRGKINLQHIDDAGFDYQPETISQTAADVKKDFGQLSLARDFESFGGEYRAQMFDEKKHRNSYKLPGQSSVIYYKSDVEQVQHDIELHDVPAAGDNQKNSEGWKVSGRYTTHKENSGDSNGLRDTNITLTELDSQKVWTGEGYELVGGFNARHDQLNQLKGDVVEIADKSNEGYEEFLQYTNRAKQYEWIAGARLQQDSDYGNHSAVRLSGMEKFSIDENSQWRLRGGIGQSYRVPTLKERFYIFDHSNLGYMVLGSDTLKPETALTANASLDYFHALNNDAGSIESEINVHHSDGKHLIDTVLDNAASASQGLQIFRYQNFEKTEIYGADFSGKYQYKDLSIQLNYSYLYAEDSVTGARLPNRPRHQIKTNFGYHIPKYDLDSLLYFVYEADEFSGTKGKPIARDHYLTANFTLSQNLTRDLSWRLGVENMFDEHQDPRAVSAGEFDERPISSRNVFAGITFNFF